MSDLITMLKLCAHVKLTKQQAQHLADLIEQQQARIAELEQREQELAATVGRLRDAMMAAICVMPSGKTKADLRDAYDSTSPQNLNGVKREAYADGYYQGFCDAWHSDFDWEQDHVNYGLQQSEIKAEQEYSSIKDGE